MSTFCGNFSCGLWIGALPPSPHLPLLELTERSADGLKDLDLLNWLDLPQVLVCVGTLLAGEKLGWNILRLLLKLLEDDKGFLFINEICDFRGGPS